MAVRRSLQADADELEAGSAATASARCAHDFSRIPAHPAGRVSDDPRLTERAAIYGVSGAGGPLPHLATIQRSFGAHDVAGVTAHLGGGPTAASHAIGARAYTTGSHVAFADSPSLRLVAHEAAHVVQQRGGVQPQAGSGGVGDPYERHADAVADLVVQGRSAEAPLDRFATPGAMQAGAQGSGVVQRAPVDTYYGKFKDESFEDVKLDGKMIGVDLYLKFTPNAQVDATKIALSQSVKNYVDGKAIAVDVTKANQQVKAGPGAGYYIDQLSEYRNPLYATAGEPAKDQDKLEAYATPSPVTKLDKAAIDANKAKKLTGAKYGGWGEHGHRYKDGASWKTKDAELHDNATLPTAKPDSGKLFETTAIAIDGAQKGTYYGSVSWGLKTDAAGVLSKVALTKASEAVPTQDFMAAAKQWSATTARGTLVTAADDTKVYDAKIKEQFKLKKDVKLDQQSTAMAKDVVYLFVKIDAAEATHGGKTGYVAMSDVKDKGGKANVPLPFVKVSLTTAAVKLYLTQDKKDEVVELAKDTRVKVIKTEGAVTQIEVVAGANTGKGGWIDNGNLKDEA